MSAGDLIDPELEVERLRAQIAELTQERDMLRGVHCLVDGDGPCGVCIKCLRLRAEAVEQQLQALRQGIEGRIVRWREDAQVQLVAANRTNPNDREWQERLRSLAFAFDNCAKELSALLSSLAPTPPEKEQPE